MEFYQTPHILYVVPVVFPDYYSPFDKPVVTLLVMSLFPQCGCRLNSFLSPIKGHLYPDEMVDLGLDKTTTHDVVILPVSTPDCGSRHNWPLVSPKVFFFSIWSPDGVSVPCQCPRHNFFTAKMNHH